MGAVRRLDHEEGCRSTEQGGGRITYRFHARDLHLAMGPAAPGGASVKFRVLIDGQPPGGAHGIDVDEQGHGTVAEQGLNSSGNRIPLPTDGSKSSFSPRGSFRLYVRLIEQLSFDPRWKKIDPHRRYLLRGAAGPPRCRRALHAGFSARTVGVTSTKAKNVVGAAVRVDQHSKLQTRSPRLECEG
jgi:thioredoxin family protein